MALVPDQKFSTFQDGGTPTTGDIIVGLRAGINTKFNWVLPGSVDTITGTDNQVLVDGSSGVPVTGDVTLTTPQDIAPISTPTFIGLNLSDYIKGALGIKDSNGNINLGFGSIPSSVNYISINNNVTGSGPDIRALGTDSDININIIPFGAGTVQIISANPTNPLVLTSGTGAQRINNFLFANTVPATFNYTFPDLSGTIALTSQITPQSTTYVDTTPYNVLTTDEIILVATDVIAASSSIVLPAAPTRDGQVWTIKDFGNHASNYPIVISVSGGGLIGGISTYVLGNDNEAVSIAWSESQATYEPVYSFYTVIPVLRLSGNLGTAAPTLGVITINGGTTGLTTSASGSTMSLTGILNSQNGGTGVNNGSNTLTLGGNLVTSGAFDSTFTMTGATNVTFPTSGTLATTSQIPTGAALTKTDDTNVTLTLGGTPATALLQATSLTLGWTGTLSGIRGGTGVNNGANTATFSGNLNFANSFTTSGNFAVTQTYTGATNVTFPTSGTLATTSQLVTPAALTKTDDTNVTLTLGGSPSTALVNSASLTLGWTGQLSVPRGGSGLSSATAYAVLCGGTTSTGAFQSVASVGTTGQVLTSNGAGALPTFQSVPGGGTVSAGLINQLAWYAANGTTVGGLSTANNGILVTSAGGVPSIGNTVGAGLTMPSITFNSTSGIIGTTTNNDAATGSVGEFLSNTSASTGLSNNTITNITSETLGAGDWDVWGEIQFNAAGSTVTTVTACGVSSTSATFGSFLTQLGSTTNAGAGTRMFATTTRFSLPSPTTIYLVGYASFSVSTMNTIGTIFARRPR